MSHTPMFATPKTGENPIAQPLVAPDLIIHAERALIDGVLRPASVYVTGGRITAITALDPESDTALPGITLPPSQVLLPGLVDTHVHVNEPGRTEWEGFDSATRAAARGGVTTLLDMPLNSIPVTTTVAALEEKLAAAIPQLRVDVGFWGGAVPENGADLRPLHEAGVFGFKAFLAPSGIDEFGHLTEAELNTVLAALAEDDALLIVHAESPAVLDAQPESVDGGYPEFLRSRPEEAERDAIRMVIEGLDRTGGRAHILHLSAASALDQIRAAKAAGLRLSVETCPHYLGLSAEDVPAGGTEFKCCPPIRDAGNRAALWAALFDGTIDTIASDHSPSTIEQKRRGDGDFRVAWGGVSGLEVELPVVWTAAREFGMPLERVIRLLAEAPARLVGLNDVGSIAVGNRAHLIAFDPDAAFTVHAEHLAHRNKISAFDGRTLHGVVERVWLHGTELTEDSAPSGQVRRRG